ncbi:MAG: Lpg1974 family pore-forming outer membrane protein [Gemmataceae bacterium]
MRRNFRPILALLLSALPAIAHAQPRAAVILPPGLVQDRPAPVTVTAVDTPGPASSYGGLKAYEAPLGPPPDVSGADHARCSRFLVFGDGLYWTVHNSSVTYAQPFNGNNPAIAVPRGPVATVEQTYEPGFRVGAGFAVNDHSWIIATFTYMQNTADDNVQILNAGDVLRSPLIFPNTANAAFAPLSAQAGYHITMYTGDIDYKCAFVDNDCLRLSWLAGARYGHLRQNLDVAYQEILGVDRIHANVGFDGGGPRVGLDGEYRVKCGLYGYARGALSLVAGTFTSLYEQRDIFGGLVAQSSINETRIIPILELELGVGWRSQNDRVRVAAGYYVGSWFNTLTIPGIVQGVQNNNFQTIGNNFRDNLTFDGVVARIEFRF